MYSIGFKTDAAISDLKKNKKFKQVSENEMSLHYTKVLQEQKKLKTEKKTFLPGSKTKNS